MFLCGLHCSSPWDPSADSGQFFGLLRPVSRSCFCATVDGVERAVCICGPARAWVARNAAEPNRTRGDGQGPREQAATRGTVAGGGTGRRARRLAGSKTAQAELAPGQMFPGFWTHPPLWLGSTVGCGLVPTVDLLAANFGGAKLQEWHALKRVNLQQEFACWLLQLYLCSPYFLDASCVSNCGDQSSKAGSLHKGCLSYLRVAPLSSANKKDTGQSLRRLN